MGLMGTPFRLKVGLKVGLAWLKCMYCEDGDVTPVFKPGLSCCMGLYMLRVSFLAQNSSFGGGICCF